MIISKKKFNEAIEKAVNEAVKKERDKYKEKENAAWARKQSRCIHDSMWDEIDTTRRNLIDVTKELNDVVAYLCDKNPDFAKKKLEGIKKKSSLYNITSAPHRIVADYDVEPCDDPACEP